MDRRIVLREQEIPRQWYNLAADLPGPPLPPLDPATRQPLTTGDLAPLLPMESAARESSVERWIPIPPEVLEVYRPWRPTPLLRAGALERALSTPARIFYKYEGTGPAETGDAAAATAQVFYSARAGMRRVVTGTASAAAGDALAFAARRFGLACTVYLAGTPRPEGPSLPAMARIWGAEVAPSPSSRTAVGRRIRAEEPEGEAGPAVAVSEAVEDAREHADTAYAPEGVFSHALLSRTVVGLEARTALERMGEFPDVVVGYAGVGGDFAGIAFPFLADRIGGRALRALACEPAAFPGLTRGELRYDFPDAAGLAPLLPMYTLGHSLAPPRTRFGELRYHATAPLVSRLRAAGLVETAAFGEKECLEAGLLFARTEGILPGPESAHAVRGATIEAERCRREGRAETILLTITGHGGRDLRAYDAFMSGAWEEAELPEEEISRSLASLKGLPRIE